MTLLANLIALAVTTASDGGVDSAQVPPPAFSTQVTPLADNAYRLVVTMTGAPTQHVELDRAAAMARAVWTQCHGEFRYMQKPSWRGNVGNVEIACQSPEASAPKH